MNDDTLLQAIQLREEIKLYERLVEGMLTEVIKTGTPNISVLVILTPESWQIPEAVVTELKNLVPYCTKMVLKVINRELVKKNKQFKKL